MNVTGNSKKEKKFISLVVYLHNVEEYIRFFMRSIIPVFEDNFEKFEIVCVDDGCTDGTIEKLKGFLEENQVNAMVNIIHMSYFQAVSYTHLTLPTKA